MTGRLAALGAGALWGAVAAAAAGSRAGAAGTVAALCRSGGSTRLGWVRPAPWPLVRGRLAAIGAALDAPEVVLLGTGGWCFAAQALGEATGTRGRLVPLDSLDPGAIGSVLLAGSGRHRAYLAVSGSGTTLEARMLVAVVSACLPGRLVWLRDETAPPDGFALSPHGTADQVAMLGAPLSMAFLAAADIVDSAGLAAAYPRFLRRRAGIAARAARRATGVAVAGPVRVRFVAPRWSGPGLRRWLLQLGRQVLCGKSGPFRPAVEVSAPGELAPVSVGPSGGQGEWVRRAVPGADAAGEHAAGSASLDFAAYPRGLPALLEICYAAGVFTACLGLRAGIEVADHPNVRAYKDHLPHADPDAPPAPPVAAADLPAHAAAWLAARPRVRRLHAVRYWAGGPDADPVAARLAAAAGLPCEMHEGSAWNHHSFQAVYADPGTAVLLLTRPTATRDGLPRPVAEAARTLDRIALATHRALPDRSLLLAVEHGTVAALPATLPRSSAVRAAPEPAGGG